MSKCDTMKVGETIRLTHRETEETITVRVVSADRGVAKVATDAAPAWIIAKLPVCGEEKD